MQQTGPHWAAARMIGLLVNRFGVKEETIHVKKITGGLRGSFINANVPVSPVFRAYAAGGRPC